MNQEIALLIDTCKELLSDAMGKLYPHNKDYQLSIVSPEDKAWKVEIALTGHISPWVNPDISNTGIGTLFGARLLTSKVINSPIVF